MQLTPKRPTRKGKKDKYLLLIHYPNGKHHIFITIETERQLLKRITSICYEKADKIAYLNVYTFLFDDILQHYGEYQYRFKNFVKE